MRGLLGSWYSVGRFSVISGGFLGSTHLLDLSCLEIYLKALMYLSVNGKGCGNLMRICGHKARQTENDVVAGLFESFVGLALHKRGYT